MNHTEVVFVGDFVHNHPPSLLGKIGLNTLQESIYLDFSLVDKGDLYGLTSTS